MSSLERLGTISAPATAPRSGTLRGRRYGEDRLHLLVRDPRRVFAAWELSEGLARAAEARAAAAAIPVRYQLVLERADQADSTARDTIRVELPDALGGEGWYVELPHGGGWCRALLGLALPEGFATLLASRWMPVPPGEPCREEGTWPADEAHRSWLAAEGERLRGRAAAPIPSSASRYLLSPKPPKP